MLPTLTIVAIKLAVYGHAERVARWVPTRYGGNPPHKTRTT
jgi:hypothetical protein